jgi:hypothetical protein
MPEDPAEESFAEKLDRFEKRSEEHVDKVLSEVRNERIIRAEKFAGYMRTWLTILTPTITVAFIIAGMIGYRSFSDLESLKKQMQQSVDAVAARKQEVDDEVQKAEQQLTNLRGRQQTLDQNLSSLESRYANVKTKIGVASTAPIILKLPTRAVGWMTIEGRNFGKSQGQLLVLVQEGSSASEPIRVEQSSIHGWSDASISVFLSQADVAALSSARQYLSSATPGGIITSFPTRAPEPSSLCFQVVTADAKASDWSLPISWP